MNIADQTVHPIISTQAPGQRTLIRPGMTLRQHYAGLAMQGLMANDFDYPSAADFAAQAVTMADALIAELEKPIADSK